MDRIFYSDVLAVQKQFMALMEQLETETTLYDFNKIRSRLDTTSRQYIDLFHRWEKIWPEAGKILLSEDAINDLLVKADNIRDTKFGNSRESAYRFLESRTDADTVEFVKTNVWKLEKTQSEEDIVGIIYHIAHCRGLRDDVCMVLTPDSTNYVSIRSLLEATN